MSSNFADQLRDFSRKTSIRMDQVVRKVVIDMTRDLVQLTPVDTGLARSNWFFGAEIITSDLSTIADKNGRPSLERMFKFVTTLQAGGVFYITNNLPYIMPLEYGHSKQAPAGMARITVDRWQRTVDRVARSL